MTKFEAGLKCPKCKGSMEVEDSRCDTDRGTMGGVVVWCVDCKYQCNEYGDEEEYEKVIK